ELGDAQPARPSAASGQRGQHGPLWPAANAAREREHLLLGTVPSRAAIDTSEQQPPRRAVAGAASLPCCQLLPWVAVPCRHEGVAASSPPRPTVHTA
ncbi:hypothetical protein Dimus_010511, partial [Dionaea muscipula]